MPSTARCLIVCCLLLAACDRKAPSATPSATSAPVIEAAPDTLPAVDATPRVVDDTAPVDARVASIDISDRAGGDPRATPFAPDAVVHLAIHTDSTTSPYTLTAKWLAPDGAVLTEYGQRVETAGAAVTDFSLSRPDGWPPGNYTVELAINGRQARDASFTVR